MSWDEKAYILNMSEDTALDMLDMLAGKTLDEAHHLMAVVSERDDDE